MGEKYIFNEKDPYFKEHAAERFLSQIQVEGDGEKLVKFLLQFFTNETNDMGLDGYTFFRVEEKAIQLTENLNSGCFHDEDKGKDTIITLCPAKGNRISSSANKSISDGLSGQEKSVPYAGYFRECGKVSLIAFERKDGFGKKEKHYEYFVTDIPGAPGNYYLSFHIEWYW